MATIVEQELEEVLADLPEPAEDDVLAGEFINDEVLPLAEFPQSC